MKRYLGVDLHRTQFVVCTRWENGEQEIRQWRIGELARFVEQLQAEDQIAVEAMGTTARFYDAVAGRVERVVVVNPHQFKVISESVKKTDRQDAQALALYLEKDLLPEVRMKPKQNRELMHLAETRDLLVKQRSALKGKINNLLAMQGIELKREALSSRLRWNGCWHCPSAGWCSWSCGFWWNRSVPCRRASWSWTSGWKKKANNCPDTRT
jgi:transposase